MKLGIIGPTEREVQPVLDVLSQPRVTSHARLDFHAGKYKSLDLVALYSGVCKVNAAIAAQLLIDRFDVSHIILSGVAGGIDKTLKIGDTVIGTSIGYHDVDPGILTDYHPWMPDPYYYPTQAFDSHMKDLEDRFQGLYRGRIVTGEAFISKEGRGQIIQAHDPLCVDMETGAVAQVCYANEIPFYVIRTITDTEEYCGEETFDENCQMASERSFMVLKHLLDGLDSCK